MFHILGNIEIFISYIMQLNGKSFVNLLKFFKPSVNIKHSTDLLKASLNKHIDLFDLYNALPPTPWAAVIAD